MTSPPPTGPPTLPAGLEARQTESGLEILDVRTGEGPAAADGSVLVVHCRGWLTNGIPVEDTQVEGRPAELTLGAGQVVPGFEEGVRGMKVGGRRRLILPSDIAYGSQGHGNLIPPYATLIYDVELIAVR